MQRPQSPQYVTYWGSLRPCLVTTSGTPATRPVPPSPPSQPYESLTLSFAADHIAVPASGLTFRGAKGDWEEMRLNRYAVGAVAVSAAVLVGGGAALAASGTGDRGARCEERLARIAEKRGVSVEQLQTDVKARLLARIDVAERAGRISSERAAQLRQRVSEGSLCAGRHHVRARIAVRGMLMAAADFLGLDRGELRAQLPGSSLAGLAEKQGKSASALEAAMIAPAKARLVTAVANGRITQARADIALDRLEKVAERLATKVFPTT